MALVRLFLFFSLFVLPTFAADLDVKAAKDRYERQRRISDQAKQRLDTQGALLNQAESEVNQAVSEEQSADETLRREQRKLTDFDNRITSYEREISGLEEKLDTANRNLSNVEQKLSPLYPKKTQLEGRVEDLRQRVRTISDKIAEVEAKDPKDPQLEELRNRKRKLEQECDQAVSNLSQVQSSINQLENEKDQIERNIAYYQRELRDKRLELSQTQRERDRQLIVIEDARDDVRRAEQKTSDARRKVDSIRPVYLAAQNDYQREKQLTDEAYSYYQEVVANYNAALNAVYAKADGASSQHGAQEAADRAPEKGTGDGLALGQSQAKTKGDADGNARELASGYREGREKGSSAPGLATFYAKGIDQGRQIAIAKANAEEFPLGYNAALKSHFASVPTNLQSVDITEQISSDPGGSGNVLSLVDKTVGSVGGPSFDFLQTPTFAPPAYATPGVTVPATIKAYFNPPCAGLVLPEFEPLCLKRYEAGYLSSFDSNYQAVYRKNFKVAFEERAADVYKATLAGAFKASFDKGLAKGAEEQGVLDGFAQNLAAVKKEQYDLGQKALIADVKTGGLLVFREASLFETTGDGLFTPGEKVKLRIVVDNYGLEATALSKSRIRITELGGLGEASFMVRELPALAAFSRTTLEGVTTLPIATEFPGEKMALSGVLEMNQNGSWKTVGKLAAGAETRFPLELSDVVLPKVPKVDEKLKATFQFKNNLSHAVEGVKVGLRVVPGFVTLTGEKGGDLGKLEPGETKELSLEIQPRVWVGENTYVKFLSDTAIGDSQSYAQALAKFIHMDRNASLLLLDSMGKAIPSSTLTVKAGSRLVVNAKIAFHAKGFAPGPFQVRVGKPSNPLITSTPNSTVGVNYGSLSPTSQPGAQPFSFEIPKELAGKSEYVMITLSEGNPYTHVMMVYLNIVP